MNKECTCPINSSMSFDELIDAVGLKNRKPDIKMCTERLGYMCPNLLKYLERARLDRDRRTRYERRLRREGYRDEQISSMKTRRRRRDSIVLVKKRVTHAVR